MEQKNGAVVRHMVGYERFARGPAYRQLTELYRAVRLYVNYFQPSMKRLYDPGEDQTGHQRYDEARTPLRPPVKKRPSSKKIEQSQSKSGDALA